MLGALVWRSRGVPELGFRGRWCGGPCYVSLGRFPGLGAWGVTWTGSSWGDGVVVPGLEV